MQLTLILQYNLLVEYPIPSNKKPTNPTPQIPLQQQLKNTQMHKSPTHIIARLDQHLIHNFRSKKRNFHHKTTNTAWQYHKAIKPTVEEPQFRKPNYTNQQNP